MNKNIIQFIVDENGQYISIPVGRVKAKSNLTTRIQLVTPITASVAVNYLIYDSKNINKKQYLIPTGDLGSAVVDPNNPNYQLVAGWKVYEADIYAPVLSVISKYRTGKVGMSFEFVEQVPNALCTNFVDYFGFMKQLPETANNGDYFICEDYNFWLDDKLYNKGDILVWYNEQWNDGGILPKALTETVDISVDPAISYPTEEVDETAFGNAIGELAEEVADLITITNSFSETLSNKQDKVDVNLNTTSKQVVGAINENKTNIENNYNVLNNNKLDKNFNLLVERTYAQLTDFVAVRSGDQTLKMALQTLRTYLTQGLVGLSFQIMELLPLTGVGNVFYLIPMVDTIEHFTNFADFPSVGEEKKLYIADDEHTGGATGWYNWDVNTETYVSYNLGYYEYIWLEEISKFELIGSTQVDLTGYATQIWVTNNFVTKTQLAGGTTGQVLTKNSDDDGDYSWKEIPEINVNGISYLRDPDKTYLVIKTPTDNDEFTLLTGTSGSPNYTIDWGDSSSEDIVGTSNPTHTYEKAGMYLITISGNFTNGIVVGNSANVNKGKMIEVYGGNNYPTNIENYAFRNCTNLKFAYFPYVTTINGNLTFAGCTTLEYIYFPLLTYIYNNAFINCSKLIEIYLPRVEIIETSSFQNCINLTTAYFPRVTDIGSDAFNGCTNLTTVNFPNATSINGSAFSGCINLTTAYFPKVTYIGNYAFRNCTNLKYLTLGNVTTSSATNTFQNVVLDNLTISGNITDADIIRIKDLIMSSGGSFSQSYEIKHGLQVDKIPTADNDVVRKIDLDAKNILYNNAVVGLVAENVQDAIDELALNGGGGSSYVPNTLIDPAKTYLVIKTPEMFDEFTLFTGTDGNPDYIIDWGDGSSEHVVGTSNPTHIYEKAGMYLITISENFENGIYFGIGANVNKNKMIEVYGGTNYPTSISSYAFQNCINLTTAYFPRVTSISDGAFRICTSLTTANFPNVTSIGNNAFRDCTNLTTANFPNVESIGYSAFDSCTNLTTVNIPNATSIDAGAFTNCISLTTANFPNVTSIGDNVFQGCRNLITANFPNATSIGGFAFSYCQNLTKVNIPNVTSISNYAFQNCINLKHLTLGNVTTTDSGTRFNNVKLVNLTIAQDVDTTDTDRIKQFYADNGGTFTGAQINSI